MTCPSTPTHPHGSSVGARLDAGCLASARAWRREAEALRHQADAAEQQSDCWLDAIVGA